MVSAALLLHAGRIVLLANVAFAGAVFSDTTTCAQGEDVTSLLQVTTLLSKRQPQPIPSFDNKLAPASLVEGQPAYVSPASPSADASRQLPALPLKLPSQEVSPELKDMLAGLNNIIAKLPAESPAAASPAMSFGGFKLPDSLKRIPPDSEVHLLDPELTNFIAVGMLVFVCLAIAVAAYFSHTGKDSTFPAWMVAALVICYLMWGVGIFMTNSSMLMVWQTITGDKVVATRADPATPGIMRPSPAEMVRNLIQSPIAAVKSCGIICCVLAFLGPVVRLMCLLAGEYWRHQESTVANARLCLLVVQRGSKWASPVFLLMIITHCQFLAMDNGNDVITKSNFEIGWMGYFLFCVTNLTLALSIKIPQVAYKAVPANLETEFVPVSRRNLAYSVGLAGVCYLCLLAFSIFSGTFSYDLQLPAAVWLGVPSSVHATVSLTQVSIWQSITMLLGASFTSLQLMPLLAALCLIVLLIILPALDMCCLVMAVQYASENENFEKAQKALDISSKIRYCLMSDVLVGSFYLMSISGMFVLHEAVLALVGAEVIRYVVTYAVVENGVGIADYLNKAKASKTAKSTPWVEWDGGRWKVDRRI